MMPVLVSLEELRSVVGDEGDCFQPFKDNLYDLAECVQTCLARTGDAVSSEVVDCRYEINLKKTDLNNIESELNEIQSKLVSGAAFYTEDTERVLSEVLVNVKNRIWSIHGTYPRMVLGKTAQQIEEILREPILEVLGCLRQYRKEDFRSRNIKPLPESNTENEEND